MYVGLYCIQYPIQVRVYHDVVFVKQETRSESVIKCFQIKLSCKKYVVWFDRSISCRFIPKTLPAIIQTNVTNNRTVFNQTCVTSWAKSL